MGTFILFIWLHLLGSGSILKVVDKRLQQLVFVMHIVGSMIGIHEELMMLVVRVQELCRIYLQVCAGAIANGDSWRRLQGGTFKAALDGQKAG